MKTKSVFRMAFLAAFLLLNANLFSQETKQPKKALDAFTTATTKSADTNEPVPGAEITVEQVPGSTIIKPAGGGESGPAEKTQFDVILKSKLFTNDKGEFTLQVSPDQFKKLPEEFILKFTIKPKDINKYPVKSNIAKVKVKKSYGPKFSFTVTWQKPLTKETTRGSFNVNPKSTN